MNESASNGEPFCNPAARDDAPQGEAPPQFGAVDIVEAFTAMRHEWRGQTKESRALAEHVQAAADNLLSLEARLLARVASSPPDESSQARQLAQIIVETDHQLTRALAALENWEASRRLREAAWAKSVEQRVAEMNGVARWLARPLLSFLAEQRSASEAAPQDPATEGLKLMLARLRRAMNDCRIERLDTEGEAFDADTMYAIGTVAAPDCPSGHVAEQLSPAYRWQGQILRFADVRVAE